MHDLAWRIQKMQESTQAVNEALLRHLQSISPQLLHKLLHLSNHQPDHKLPNHQPDHKLPNQLLSLANHNSHHHQKC